MEPLKWTETEGEVRRFESPRFGPVDVDEDKIIHFPKGLPGFPGCTEFVVMDHDTDTPLKWLQCIDLPEIAFLVIEPEQILLSYALDIPEPVLAFLGWQKETGDPRDVIVFVILTVLDSNLTANLRAPVVVNVKKRRAQQMILDDPEIPLQHPVRPDPDAKAEREAG